MSCPWMQKTSSAFLSRWPKEWNTLHPRMYGFYNLHSKTLMAWLRKLRTTNHFMSSAAFLFIISGFLTSSCPITSFVVPLFCMLRNHFFHCKSLLLCQYSSVCFHGSPDLCMCVFVFVCVVYPQGSCSQKCSVDSWQGGKDL